MRDADRADFISILALFLVIFGITTLYLVQHPEDEPTILKSEPIQTVEVIESEETTNDLTEEEPAQPKTPIKSDEEIIAMVVMAEAGNQDMLGKVAVASVVLNRVDYFGTTVESVVNEPNQFSYPYYGTVSDECYRAVEIAEKCRDLFPADMLYFRAYKYHDFGTPYEQIGDHYFSLRED